MAGIVSNFKTLEGISSGSGEPRFPIGQTNTEAQDKLDNFVSNQQTFGAQTSPMVNTLDLPNDILVVRYKSNDAQLTSYETYSNKGQFEKNLLLQYNYNMTTGSVDVVFSRILQNIAKELTPPKTSKTFTYDFKFAQNQNASISGSRGGGY